MFKSKNTKSSRVKTTSFKSFGKLPFLEEVLINGRTYNTRQFFNRDMSWLSFNERVLSEAISNKNPILERLKFIDIFRSNNDEFFMKRVSLLIKRIESGDKKLSIDGRNSLDLYNEFLSHIESNWKTAKIKFENLIMPELQRNGIKLCKWNEISKDDQSKLRSYFHRNIFPVLTPLAVNQDHSFPFISNLSKSIGVCITQGKNNERHFARVKIPTQITQWISIASESNKNQRFINIEEIILNNLIDLFPGMNIESTIIFRVTRDASSMGEDDEDIENVVDHVTEGLIERKFSSVVRLEVDSIKSKWLIDFLSSELDIHEEQVFKMPSLICYTDFSGLIGSNCNEMKFKTLKSHHYAAFQHLEKPSQIFDEINKQSHLVHFPFESFESSLEKFLLISSNDSKVMAIKIVLYRTDTDGRLIDILINAAQKGKQVTVVIEIKARFDEESNIKWAQRLEDCGIHVTYGVRSFKTHAKMILVVRKESNALKTYVNIGTGNFNRITSQFYTDLSFFSADKYLGEEVIQVFNYLTGRCIEGEYQNMFVAPFNMRQRFLNLIQKEIEFKWVGQKAEIIAKMNSLEDPEIIEALYKAGRAGVKITLIVRGFCCLKPGVKDLSENIRVLSLVGRFLEHSRIYYFRNGADKEINGEFFIGSADWMKRNLNNRVEVIIPILQNNLKTKIMNILDKTIEDNYNLWELSAKGRYKQKSIENEKLNAHSRLLNLAD